MSPWDRVVALRVLCAERGRTLLTLLGIVIGCAAIVLLAGLTGGAKVALVQTAQSATGADLITVREKALPEEARQRGRPELSRSDQAALSDAWATRHRGLYAESSRDSRARSGGRHKRVRFVSGNGAMLSLFRLQVEEGRFLTDGDLERRRRVCVVGHEVWSELLRRQPITAEPRITADGVQWTVVGVLKRKPMMGSTTGTHIWDRKVIVPQTSFDALYAPDHRVQRIVISAGASRPALPVDEARSAVRRLLSRRHHGADNFELDDAAARAQERLILGVIEVLLMAVGALALFAGGINVANVMLVNVSERTREIGLRRALGETRASILSQFLLEATALSLLGGAFGLVVGSALVGLTGWLLTQMLGVFPAEVQAWSLLLGLALSLVTGLGAGLAPALRAARLDPVAALRSE